MIHMHSYIRENRYLIIILGEIMIYQNAFQDIYWEWKSVVLRFFHIIKIF